MQKKLNAWSRSRLTAINAMRPIMLPCSEATRLISDSMDGKLPLRLRVRVRLHLSLCKWCRRFERQLALMKALITQEEESDDKTTLPDAAKDSIKQEMLRRLK